MRYSLFAHRNRENTQSFTHPPTLEHFLNYELSYALQSEKIKSTQAERTEHGECNFLERLSQYFFY